MARDYNDLLADIPAWMENDTPELAAALPGIIAKAQLRMSRVVNVQGLDVETAGLALTPKKPSIPKPPDFIQTRSLRIYPVGWLPTAPIGAQLRMRLVEYGHLLDWCPDDSVTGTPKYYAIQDGGSYRVGPAPDQAYPYVLNYKARPPMLSPTVVTNFWTSACYDLLKEACLYEGFRFVMDDREAGKVKECKDAFEELVKQVNDEDRRADRDDNAPTYVDEDNR